MLNLGLRKTKQETTAPQIISFHQTLQSEKHKDRTPKGLRSQAVKRHQHHNTANPHVPLTQLSMTFFDIGNVNNNVFFSLFLLP